MNPQRPLRDGIPASCVQLPPAPFVFLLDGLCARFPAITRDDWLQRLDAGLVLDQAHRPLRADAAYEAGRQVYYFREVDDEPRIPFEAVVLHADAHLVVVDKPHFLPVAPAGAFVRETVLSRLMRKLDNPHLSPLHRIDRGTAGLIMLSASPSSRDAYQALFRDRLIGKTYEALAPALEGRAWPLLRESRLVAGEPFFRMQETPGPANAFTRLQPIDTGGSIWRYALWPLSGRKHQLRVHMAALGAGILNDRTYPVLLPEAADDYHKPLQLLARSLRFADPLSGRERVFSSQLALAHAPERG